MKELSKMIRMQRKGRLDADMDYAGQEAPNPQDAYLAQKYEEMDDAMDMKPETSATDSEMGEGDSSQKESSLKKIMMRIEKYLTSLR